MEKSIICSSYFLLVFSLFISYSEAYTFYAGGKDGWVLHPSESYSTWASRNRFQINDTIVFQYKKGEDSVLVVNQPDYDQCNLNNPVQKMDTGDSVFTFDRSGAFFFVSGTGDRCKQGEKLVVIVLAERPKIPVTPTPPLGPSPVPSSPPVAPPQHSPVSPPSVSPVPSSSPVAPPKDSPASSPSISPVPSSSPVAPPKSSPASPPSIPPVAPPTNSPVSSPKTSPSPFSSPASSPSVSQGPTIATPPPSGTPGAQAPGAQSPANSPDQAGAPSEVRVSTLAIGLVVLMYNYCFIN